jgi:hypothetical protein
MECELCGWKGKDPAVYAQHCVSLKHTLRARIHALEQEVDPYSDYNLTIKMTRDEVDSYIKERVKRMPRAELERYALRVLYFKSTSELKFRMIQNTLFAP